MNRGDFYASAGVTLSEMERTATGIRLVIEPAAGVNYTTRFIEMRREQGKAGAMLGEVHGPEARFDFTGDEAYVRALVTSDCPHPRPTIPGDMMKAWIQPVYPD